MVFAYLDASALAKRYVPEPGTLSVNHLFHRLPAGQMVVFNIGIAEVVSILVRKRNAGVMPGVGFAQALKDVEKELILSSHITRLMADDRLVAAAIALIQIYSLNSTDAILLRSALDLAITLRQQGNDLVLVTADQRLLNAGRTEGLTVFNPETQSPTDLDTLLGP